MKSTCMELERRMLLCILKTCARSSGLEQGRQVHAHIVINDEYLDVVLGTSLLGMYSKCGSLGEARCVFDRLPVQTEVSWGMIISAYVEHGLCSVALELFDRLQLEGIIPDKLLFAYILKAFIRIGTSTLMKGKKVHCQLLSCTLGSEVVVGNTLIDFYIKWGTLDDAHRVFHVLPFKSIITWSAIISGCIHHGEIQRAVRHFEKMLQEGIMPDRVAFICILKACTGTGAMQQGKLFHSWIVECGHELDVVVGSALVEMYAKYAFLKEACETFTSLRVKTVTSWSSLIRGHVENGCALKALGIYIEMYQDGIVADEIVLLCILKACGNARLLIHGYLVHCEIVDSGLISNMAIRNSLVNMYVKCSSLEDAWYVFSSSVTKTVVSWSAMIFGYAGQGQIQKTLFLLDRMRQDGVECNEVTFICGLKACGISESIQQGRILHSEALKNGFESDVAIGSSLVDMYARCGYVKDAGRVFDTLPSRNIICWGAMLTAHVLHGQGAIALDLFQKLLQEGHKPGRVAHLCCLMACRNLGSLTEGQLVHDMIIRNGFDTDVVIVNSLLDMYLKCGDFREASLIFSTAPSKDIVSWGTMMWGYLHSGNHTMVIEHLKLMHSRGLCPNADIDMLALSACSHAGLLKEGQEYMNSAHGARCNLPHYGCLAHLLARTGNTIAGKDLLVSLPHGPGVLMWMSLLTSCRTYGNPEIGELCLNILDRYK